MKYKLLKGIIVMTKYAFYALFTMMLCFSTMLASETRAQKPKSVQEVIVDVHFKNATLQEAFQQIERKTSYRFMYDMNDINTQVRLNFRAKKVSLYQILERLSKEAMIRFKQTNFDIDVRKISEQDKKISITEVQLQAITIVGKVTSGEDGEGLPGVNVILKGTFQGTVTDVEGNYTIGVPDENAVLVFSSVGFISEEVIVGDKTIIDIALVPDITALEEIVVVAYGKQKKENVLASITTIEPSELRIPSSNLTTALAGRMSGIISYQRSGEPGQDNAQFFVRGVTTFGYKKDPLILIDGVELSADDLARLNPDDISAFSIMKDATATALYGARGANGVILITTKEGIEGEAKVSVRFENSISSPTQNIELADPISYMQLHNEAVRTRDPLGILPYSRSKIENTAAGMNPVIYPAIDWHDMLFKDRTINQRLNFNISGGGKVARYYLAGSATQDNGVLKVDDRNNFNSNIDLKRYLLRSNINIDLTKTTEAVVRLHATFDDYTGPIDGGTALYNKVMRSNPALFPSYFPEDGLHQGPQHIQFGNSGAGDFINPYAEMVKGYKDRTSSLMLAQFELKQNLDFVLNGLSARFLGSVNRHSAFDVSRFYNPFYYEASGYNPETEKYFLTLLNEDEGTEYLEYNEGGKNITSTSYYELAMDYNKTFSGKHGVSGLLVMTRREEQIANAGDLQKSLPYRNLGVSGRFTYSFDSRYFAEFNFGYNGSERFAESERFGFFPSAGLAWNVSSENFWDGIKDKVTLLRIKATYGLVGNDAIGDANDRFFYLSNVNLNDGNRAMSFGRNLAESENGVSISRYANEDITWETAKKVNLGIEMGLLGKVMINADLFNEHRTNILMDRASIPSTMGHQADVRANVGEAKSRGVDLSIDYNHIYNKDLWMTGRANFTYASSEFVVYEEPDYSLANLEHLSRVGYSLNQQWGLVAERFFVDDEEIYNSPIQEYGEYSAGDLKYYDVNNDGRINDLDRVPMGYPTTPEIVYGIGLSAGYKGFDLSVFFQSSARSSFWIDTQKTAPFIDYDDGYIGWDNEKITNNALLMAYADSHWSEENRDIMALWPRLSTYEIANNTQMSSWFMRDGTFLRLKSAEFGYTLSRSFTDRIKTDQLRFYISGTNLLTFSRFKLWDPEMAGNGLGYPVQRVVNLGVQVSF